MIIGAGTLTTGSAASTTFSGTFTGGGGTLVKTGNTAFTLTGKSTNFRGTVDVDQGKLTLNNAQLGSKAGAVEVGRGQKPGGPQRHEGNGE